MSLAEFARAVPKVELHVHLEGTVAPATLLALAKKHHVTLPAQDEVGLRRWYVFRDFPHFVEIYVTVCACLQEPDDFARVAYEYGQQMALHNIRYAEVTWSPTQHVGPRLSFVSLLDAVNAGRAQAARDFGVRMQWIPDIVRCNPETAEQVVSWLTSSAALANGVVGLGLGGPEGGFSPELFESAFRAGRSGGLHSNPHAGETVGPTSIWGALRALGAERIGHGVRAIEDDALISYIVERRVPLEVCPSSNVCLGVVPTFEAHPLRQLADAGVCVTINSDDPALFNTTLSAEYCYAMTRCGLHVDQLQTGALDAVRASYLRADEKAALLDDFCVDYDRARSKFGLE